MSIPFCSIAAARYPTTYGISGQFMAAKYKASSPRLFTIDKAPGTLPNLSTNGAKYAFFVANSSGLLTRHINALLHANVINVYNAKIKIESIYLKKPDVQAEKKL